MTTTPQLIATSGPDDDRRYPLDQDKISLGRRSDNTVVVGWEGSVSRQHALIVRRSGLFWLEDVGSKYGTFLAPAGDEEERELRPGKRLAPRSGAGRRMRATRGIIHLATGRVYSKITLHQRDSLLGRFGTGIR